MWRSWPLKNSVVMSPCSYQCKKLLATMSILDKDNLMETCTVIIIFICLSIAEMLFIENKFKHFECSV